MAKPSRIFALDLGMQTVSLAEFHKLPDGGLSLNSFRETELITDPSADATRPGGHGAAFDWQILQGMQLRRPWFLAGGLNPQNVGRAIAISGAPMVDVSSGVESAPGVKSESLIGDFVAAARQQAAA